MIFCLVSLSVAYIFQTNFEISERYLIKEYAKKISEFSKENKILEVNSIKLTSLDKTAQLAEQSFEKTDKIHYIKVLNTHAIAK